MSQDLLFNERALSDLLYAYPQILTKKVDELDRNKLLNASLSDLVEYFIREFTLEVPRLRLDLAQALPPEDTQIDVSHDRGRDWRTPGAHFLAGTAFTLVVPFEGDPDLLKCQPSTFHLQDIFGDVKQDALVLKHVRDDHNAAEVKADFDRRIKDIEEYLSRQRSDVDQWNRELPARVHGLLGKRKQKVLAALNVAESLGFPLARTKDQTYDIPVARKRLITEPTTSAAPYIPEPALAMQQYEDILGEIATMAIVMERSPSAFVDMGEEDLRNHILVILNTHFQGQATGETFNKSGKTDILIREKGRNIFVAECKFWDGPKSLIAAIDQILSYLSWRDTKVSLIVFNRRKEISAVLAAIPETVAQHPLFKKQLDYKSEGAFRFLFGQKDDRNRELILTVMVFDVPGTPTGAAPVATPAVPSTPASAPVARPAPRRRR